MGDDGMRSRILASALTIVGERGPEGLTVRNVATAADCSTIGVYTHFGGKDGLIDAVLVDGFTSFAAALSRARPGAGPMARLRAQSKAYRRWALAHPSHYRIMFTVHGEGHEPSDEAIAAASRAHECLRSAVAEAHAAGELATDDVEAVALACWGMAHGMVSLELAGRRPPGASSSAEARAYDLALRAMAAGLTRGPGSS